MPYKYLLKRLTIMGFICLLGFGPIASYAQTRETEGKSSSLVPPTNLAGVAVSSSQINLTWTDTNTIETGYDVWTRTPAYTNYWLRASLPANTTSYQDTGRAAGTTYFYEVRARQKTSRGLNLSSFSAPICLATPASTTALPPVTLPVEVLGAAGTTATAQVNVDSTLAPSITGIWMTVHGLSYANKASVQVNNGAWVNLNNTTVTVADLGKNYGGIGGAFASLKMTLPLVAGSVVAGTNTVRFRFNGTDGLSMGFRVLAFNFVTSTGGLAIPSTSFVQDDPSTWKPPFSDSTSIATGQQVWRTAQLIHSPIDFSVIQARCTDCHAQDGRDLKYFNYSNLSIIERCKYHGLTPVQGQQVASYIRMLNGPNPGRPWNPPYQPGPGIDAKPISSWAAGAGLEWALTQDLDTLAFIFPNGITKDAVATSGNLNARQTPIALQLPDWNHWLPQIHPKDAWGTEFLNSNLLKKYNGEGGGASGWNFRERLSGSQASSYLIQDTVMQDIGEWGNFRPDLDFWVQDRAAFTNAKSNYANQYGWTPAFAEAIHSTADWQLVKMWELMQEFNLEGYGPTWYGSTGESRMWPTNAFFGASPSMLHIPNGPNGVGGSGLTNEYLSNAWYHAQVVLNDSFSRHPAENTPVDPPYWWGHSRDLWNFSTSPDGGRMIVDLVKFMQGRDNGIAPDFSVHGWSPRNADPSRLVASSMTMLFTAIPTDQKRQVFQALLQTWFDKTQQYTPLQYYAGGFADPNYVPVSNSDGQFADRVWFMIPNFRTLGVDGTLLNQICDWAKTVWPLGAWDTLKG